MSSLKGITSLTGTEKFCEPCILGKMKKLPFKRSDERCATEPLKLIHSDVGGPITPASPEGYRYWITFIDDSLRYPWTIFMRHKSEAFKKFQEWKGMVEEFFKTKAKNFSFSDNWIKFLRTDMGGEYESDEFRIYL